MRIPTAVAMIVVGLVLGFVVTVSPSWLSIGLLGSTLVIAGLAALAIAVLGRISRARRKRRHAAGPWLIAVGGTLWLAVHEPYVKGVDLVGLGFVLALTGFVATTVTAYLVSPWRGRGILSSWLRPQSPPYPENDTDADTFTQPGRGYDADSDSERTMLFLRSPDEGNH